MSESVDSKIVVAGTDTEIGKTTVTCALLAALRKAGLVVRGIKPVESGTESQPSREEEDGRRLAAAAEQAAPQEALQRLRAPLAPPVAARDEAVILRPKVWLEAIRDIAAGADLSFVEGAGGLLSPLADGFDTRDMAVALKAPVLLVAADSLGTLNHSFLTIEALQTAGCELAGVVFSAPEIPDASTGRNADVIARHFPELPAATLPRVADNAEGAELFSESPFLRRLLDGVGV